MSAVQARSQHLGNTKTSILPADNKPEWSLWPPSALVEQVMECGSVATSEVEGKSDCSRLRSDHEAKKRGL